MMNVYEFLASTLSHLYDEEKMTIEYLTVQFINDAADVRLRLCFTQKPKKFREFYGFLLFLLLGIHGRM